MMVSCPGSKAAKWAQIIIQPPDVSQIGYRFGYRILNLNDMLILEVLPLTNL